MGMISNKLRASARGETCTLQIPETCSHDPEQTVLCHVYPDGRAMGTKSADYLGVFGCHQCHMAIDQHLLPKAHELFYVLRGLKRTWSRWIERGLIILPVDPETAKRRPKRKANLPSRKIQSRPFPKKHALWPLHGGADQGD